MLVGEIFTFAEEARLIYDTSIPELCWISLGSTHSSKAAPYCSLLISS
jgi:hypothetical protein